MIDSKKDYLDYLESDRIAILKKRKRPLPFLEYEWRFTRILRKVEYYKNCKKGFLNKMILAFHKYRLYNLSLKTGITITPNCFGKGLGIFHHGTIIVNSTAKVGDDCVIQCGVNISENCNIGNRVYIAPGAKILEGVTIADGVIIGSNAVVTKDILEPNVAVAGIPARIIKQNVKWKND